MCLAIDLMYCSKCSKFYLSYTDHKCHSLDYEDMFYTPPTFKTTEPTGIKYIHSPNDVFNHGVNRIGGTPPAPFNITPGGIKPPF